MIMIRIYKYGNFDFSFFFFKQKTAYEMRISDWSSDVCSSDLKPGCEFRLGTDDPTYCRWSMMVMNRRRDFRWLAATPHDFLTRPNDWPETRYERKARRKGHEVW